jgi:hypothetical protein
VVLAHRAEAASLVVAVVSTQRPSSAPLSDAQNAADSTDSRAVAGGLLSGPFADREPLRTWVAHGLRCAIVPAPFDGAINGYVLAGPSFTLEMAELVEVHGGITYGPGPWVGFDTLHGGDVWPGSSMRYEHVSWARHWTEADVVAETERLAAEVKRVMEL